MRLRQVAFAAALAWSSAVVSTADAKPSRILPMDRTVQDAIALSDRLFKSGLYDSGATVLRRFARAGADSLSASLGFQVRIGLAEHLLESGHVDEAQRLAGETYAAALAARDTLRALKAMDVRTRIEGRRGTRQSFLEMCQEYRALAEASRDPLRRFYAEYQLARALVQAGRWRDARVANRQALAQARLAKDRAKINVALSGLASIASTLGDVEEARRSFHEVIASSRASADHTVLSSSLRNLARLERDHGDPSDALPLLEEALAVARRDPQALNLAQTRVAYQATLFRALRDQEARVQLDSLLLLATAADLPDMRAAALDGLAELAQADGQLDRAASLLRQAMALGERVQLSRQNAVRLDLADALVALDSLPAAERVLGEIHASKDGSLPASVRVGIPRRLATIRLRQGRAAQALELATDMQSKAVMGELPLSALQAQVLRARALDALGRRAETLVLMDTLVRAWESDRQGIRNADWREQRGAQLREVYGLVADVLLRTPRGAVPESLAASAFETLQRFKAPTLFERIHSPGDTLLRAPRARWRTADFQQRVLRTGELFLDFYESDSALWVIAVDRQHVRARRLPIAPRTLKNLVETLQRVLASPPPAAGAAGLAALDASAGALRDALLRPVMDQVRAADRLIVSYDGASQQTPDALLAAARGGAPLEVVRVPSAPVLHAIRTRTERSPALAMLAVAGRSDPAGRRLVGAQEEVRWLGRRFQSVDSRPGGARTRVSEVRGALAANGSLHFASHVAINDGAPWRSGVWLVPDVAGADPCLRAEQVAKLQLNVGLVVLSGCKSAQGTAVAGEGLLGLTHAFLSAGARAVVASLWNVDDRASVRFMQRFYDGLARGQTSAAALLTAREATRRDPATAHPYYWAGYVLVGDPQVEIQLRSRGLL